MLKAPFPYFGGKSSIAPMIWEVLGKPDHYIEPFFGSGAVLLARPDWVPTMTETVNDADGFICNVWRGIQFDPDEVAKWCNWPVNHADLMARKARLIREEDYLLKNLVKDDKWCDPELAGYWIWAASCWIGSGLTDPGARPNIADKGKGVHAVGQKPNLSSKGKGVHGTGNVDVYKWFEQLSHRLRRVRVVCGDWSRVCGGDWQDSNWNSVGMFFDPPYAVSDRDDVYHKDDFQVADKVREWTLKRGKRENYRIVIAGYEEHKELLDNGWTSKSWITGGGYGNTAGKNSNRGKDNRKREMLYFSPHCRKMAQVDLFSP